jgi:hypothetical protein
MIAIMKRNFLADAAILMLSPGRLVVKDVATPGALWLSQMRSLEVSPDIGHITAAVETAAEKLQDVMLVEVARELRADWR